MKAQVNKETEKALRLTFLVDLYGEKFTIKNQWMPKSMIDIVSMEDGVLEFNPNNDWILDAKVKDYCRYVKQAYSKVPKEVESYLSTENTVKVDLCWI
jgi:hypothetical protein